MAVASTTVCGNSLDGSPKTDGGRTEFADFIHVLLALYATKIDDPCLVDLALLENRF